MNLEEKLYTSTEVAQILGVSLRSVYRYLEEGKIDAEIKTATGRHRFSKQNILDFLYPNKDSQESQPNPKQNQNIEQKEKQELPKAAPQKVVEPVQEPEVVEDEVEEEQVDWLAKFREAANKFKTEEVETTQAEPIEQPKSEPTESLSSFAYEEPTEQVPEETSSTFYYRSMLGGLKEIAQNIDKSARKASVDYAFTMNAGLSLHKPIKPFSMLHVYVKEHDRDLFEKMLQLVPSEKETAQVALIVSNESSIYKNSKELHGLYVVSDLQLKSDLAEGGEEALAKELQI